MSNQSEPIQPGNEEENNQTVANSNTNQVDNKNAAVTYHQITALRKCITETIASYRIKKRRNKWGAIIVQSLSILFSFGTTVLIGWNIKEGVPQSLNVSTLTNFALIVSALATGINTLDKFFDYKTLWIGYNISISNLQSALARLDYLASIGTENVKKQELDEIFNRYELTCSNMDKNYHETRSARDE